MSNLYLKEALAYFKTKCDGSFCKKEDIINNSSSTNIDKPVSAAVATNLQNQINVIDTNVALKSSQEQLDSVNNSVVSNANNIAIHSTQIAALSNSSPHAVSLISQMTDTTKNYVYTGTEVGYVSGNWYYWNGASWVSGGSFQSDGLADGGVMSHHISGTTTYSKTFNYSATSLNITGTFNPGETYRFETIGYNGDNFNNGTLFILNGSNIVQTVGIISVIGNALTFTINEPSTMVRFYMTLTNSVSTQYTLKASLKKLGEKTLLDAIYNTENENEMEKQLNGIESITKFSNYVTAGVNDIKYLLPSKQYVAKILNDGNVNIESIVVSIVKTDETSETVKSCVLGDEFVLDTPSNLSTLRLTVTLKTGISTPQHIDISIAQVTKDNLKYKTFHSEGLKNIGNLLVIGDSYSEQRRWINQLLTLVKVDNLVNLGVGSATLRDKYTDRVAMPYTSRPVNSDNIGNHNTFACQIEKLHRLMLGTDLDVGETQIYNTESQYPNVILIEGGKNDIPDLSTDNYAEQIYTSVNDVFVKYNSTIRQEGTFYLKKELGTEDRTCFMGAIRYLYEILHGLFPDAEIYVITPSGLGWNGNTDYYIKIAEQMEYASSLLSIPVIDWAREGRLNQLDHPISGSGTEADPYVATNPSEYTIDGLHPNDKGALKLAKVVVSKLI